VVLKPKKNDRQSKAIPEVNIPFELSESAKIGKSISITSTGFAHLV
jgi:hypothetical protein